MLNKSYVAGLFDGEGCVYIRGHKRQRSHPDIEVRVTIANTNFGILALLKQQYGGTITKIKSVNERHKVCYILHMCSRIAYAFLKDIFDDSFIKRGEIKVALEMQQLMMDKKQFIKGKRGSYVPSEILEQRRQKFDEYRRITEPNRN